MRGVYNTAAIVGGFLLCLASVEALAHGDVTPHPFDVSALPKLGEKWGPNPWRGNEKAIEAGAEGYLHNCAGCHGLNVVSGGMAPDLLKDNADCVAQTGAAKASCLDDVDDFFKGVTLDGKKNSEGRYTMPAYKTVFSQEMVWALKSYVDKRADEVLGKK